MLALVVGMLFCVAISAAVIGYVAREAQRDSRDFWTPEGERMIADVRRRSTDLRARGEGLRQRRPHGATREPVAHDS